jgi:hypothetical protein
VVSLSHHAVPRCWPGRTVAVLASGPSLTANLADAVRDSGLCTIVVNSTVHLAPWADMLYAADAEWWTHPANLSAIAAFQGVKYSVTAVPGVVKLRNSGVQGFDPDPACLRTGGNSGYQALHLAVHTGAAKILLAGFDMHEPAGKEPHWHGKHPHPLRSTGPDMYLRWRQRFNTLAQELDGRVDVAHITPGSALTCFRTSTLEAELCRVPATC